MFKIFDPSRDIKTAVSPINEVLVFNGAIFTGTVSGEANVKKYNHWTSGSSSGSLYHSLYSENHTGSAAVELINITYGQSISSSLYANPLSTNKSEKVKMYRLFAKRLLGNENERFNISGSNVDNLIFLDFTRGQMKDELKKGAFSLLSMYSGSYSAVPVLFTSASMTDSGAENRWTETQKGDVANIVSGTNVVGQVYYQAGTVVLIPEMFSNTSSVVTNPGNYWSGTFDYNAMAISGGAGTYEDLLNSIRYRFLSMTIINQSNLHSTYYFCRALNDEYNYSSNPTFLDTAQRIIPTSGSNNLQTRTYISKVALVGQNGEILAVASLSRPIQKGPDIERVIKVRLDS